ncbi:MAG: DNA primase [Bdellovibrio sp.]|nr:MAG: DNA primase [Bdellovibrio sp.]
MRFSQDFINRVAESNNLVDIIAEYTQLRGRGDRFMGLCPFPDHHEKTPSFSVSHSKQVYYCFGCRRSGNIFQFLEAMKGLNFIEAVEYLADRAGIPIERDVKDKTASPKKKYYDLNKEVADFFHLQLILSPEDSTVRKYCRKRGLLKKTVKDFMLGYADESWDSLTSFLKKEKQSVKDASSLGLIKKRASGGYYDTFRNRLMFPIISLQGRVVGFGGRALDIEDVKYINSSESEIFNKSEVLYGLHKTAKYIKSEDEVLLVEGYMDVLSLYQAGVKNVVAPLGTAFTSEHARSLKKLTRNVFVLFDGDEAGQMAAERALPILLQEGLLPRGVVLPENMDPDEYVKLKGVESLKEVVRAAPELFSLVVQRLKSKYSNSPSSKIVFMEKVSDLLLSVADKGLFDLYVDEISELLSVPSDWVLSNLKGSTLKKESRKSLDLEEGNKKLSLRQESNMKGEEDIIEVENPPRAELYLLNLLLMEEGFWNRFFASALLNDISHEGIRKIIQLAQESRQTTSDFDKLTSLLVEKVSPSRYITLFMAPPFSEMSREELERMYVDCSRQIRSRALKAQIQKLKADMALASPEEQVKKLEQIMNIQRERQHLEQEKSKMI